MFPVPKLRRELYIQVLEPRRLLSHFGTEVARFGAAGDTEARVTFTDLDGTQVVAKLTGGGSGHVYSDGQALDLEITGTTPLSRLTVKSRGGEDSRATLRDVIVDGSLRSIEAPTTVVRGNVTVAGTVGRVRLAEIANGIPSSNALAPDRVMRIEGAGVPIALEAKVVGDLDAVSASPFRLIRVGQWLDVGGTENRVVAPWIGAIRAGTFAQSLSLTEAGSGGRTLGSVTAKSLSGAWAVAGNAVRSAVPARGSGVPALPGAFRA